jgi:YqjK-like protein
MIFSQKLGELARKRAELIVRSTRQRRTLADELDIWQTPAATLDRAMAMTRFLRAHPLAVAAVGGVLAVLGRRQLLRWTGRALVVWRGWRTLLTLLRTLAA